MKEQQARTVVAASAGTSVYASIPGLATASILVWEKDCVRARSILDAAERRQGGAV